MKKIVGLECIYICFLLIAQMFHSKISEKNEIKTIIKANVQYSKDRGETYMQQNKTRLV